MARFRSFVIGLSGGLVLALAGCGNGPPTTLVASIGKGATNLGSTTHVVNETDTLKFDPASITVKAKDIVEWKNTGTQPHNVQFSADSQVSNSNMNGGETWDIQFTLPGSYDYICQYHQSAGMTGTVKVNP